MYAGEGGCFERVQLQRETESRTERVGRGMCSGVEGGKTFPFALVASSVSQH